MSYRTLLPLLLLTPAAAAEERPRLQLFRVAPAFLVGVPWLDQDDRTLGGRVEPEPDSGPDWVSLAVGSDNPFLEFRPRGEAGGVGYSRLFSQIQLFDDARTACSLVVHAVTPAGVQFDGLPDHRGATVLTPALSVYHTLDGDGTALQLTLNKPLAVSNPAAQTFRRDLQCGLALHTPLSGDGRDVLANLYLSVEALGQYRTETRSPLTLDVLPGVHWKPADNWRISGAMSLPVERTDANVRSWQITCALQF
ncbi:MAG: hypothetical protein ACRC33_17100 [Gemmataceae bacterium]